MKLEETEILQLQYVINIQTTTTQIKIIQDSDTDLSEKITEILNIYEKNPNFTGKHHSKNGATIVEDMDTALLNADKSGKTTKINHRSTEKQTNHFISI